MPRGPRRPFRDPGASLPALLDTTRALSDEEMAELQIELGYLDFALAIYERLLRADPKNPWLRRRCEWLARLTWARGRAEPRAAVVAPTITVV